MSSKKIWKSTGLTEEVWARLEDEAKKRERSKHFVLDKLLRERYAIPWTGKEEKQHAN